MIELHLHLDGSLRPQTVWELAKQQQTALGVSSVEALCHEMKVPDNCTSLTEYLTRFDLPLLVLQTKEALERVTYELVEDLAKEGQSYTEIRFAPQLSVAGGLSQREVCDAVARGVRRGMTAYPGIRVGLILCCMRGADLDQLNRTTLETAADLLGDVVCAVDLAGAEALFPTSDFGELFRYADELKLPRTIHAGEAAGPDSVWKALELGAQRIGHGIHSIEDPELIRHLVKEKIPLEVCVTSNLQTESVHSLKEHPVRRLYDAGVRVTISSDNRTVSGTTLARELRLLRERFAFTENEIQTMQNYANDAAFLQNL